MTDFAIIGRGLMGTAAARHLAETGARVALIGPDEPSDPSTWTGPFASHHDAGRITRAIATDADWSRIAIRSIERYADLEDRSGILFYHRTGHLMAGPDAGPGAGLVRQAEGVAAALGTPHTRLDADALEVRFPMFRFAPGTRAVHDATGGWIDPRAMRRAEETLAIEAGAQVIRATATGLNGGRIEIDGAAALDAGHVIVATGAYAGMDALLPRRPPMRVFARTVAFVHLTEAEAAALAGMPSLIFVPEGVAHDLYVLPPIRYPDGTWRLKIGGEADSPHLDDAAGMTGWFRSGGSHAARDTLLAELRRLMPDLPMTRTSAGPCAVAFTATGHPVITRVSPHVTLLTGGNGAGAKGADELGRLGAVMARDGDLSGEGYATGFTMEPLRADASQPGATPHAAVP